MHKNNFQIENAHFILQVHTAILKWVLLSGRSFYFYPINWIYSKYNPTEGSTRQGWTPRWRITGRRPWWSRTPSELQWNNDNRGMYFFTLYPSLSNTSSVPILNKLCRQVGNFIFRSVYTESLAMSFIKITKIICIATSLYVWQIKFFPWETTFPWWESFSGMGICKLTNFYVLEVKF